MMPDFDPQTPIEEASTPPAKWYLDPEIFERERTRIFGKAWQVVGRVDQVAKPGDYFTGELLGESYVVVRGEDGEVRAFFNVCRHHAAQVAKGAGCAERFTCPYHGWTYALDGALKSGPQMGPIRNFDRGNLSLVPMPIDLWGPFIAVLPRTVEETPSPSLHTVAPELHKALEKSDWMALSFFKRRIYEVACNWKVYVDNYLDGGYHVSVLHGDLADRLSLNSYHTQVFSRSVVQTCAGDSGADAPQNLRERVGGGAIYGWIYPNFMINRYGPFMDTNFVVPMDAERCLVVFDYYCEPARLSDTTFLEDSLKASDQVQQEDEKICASVQKGLNSASYDRGRYAPKLETGAYHFHTLLNADLFGA